MDVTPGYRLSELLFDELLQLLEQLFATKNYICGRPLIRISNMSTYCDIIVIRPGIYPVYGGPRPALVGPLLLVPEEERHPVPGLVRVADGGEQ